MNVFIRFNNNTDFTVKGVDTTERRDGMFVCFDGDGDKLFASHEGNILYITWQYDYEE